MSGLDLIQEERMRQVELKGFDAAHDDKFTGGEILAGAWKVIHDVQMDRRDPAAQNATFVPCAAKVASKYKDDYLHRLVIAGALVVAEIDRILRAEGTVISDAKPDAVQMFTVPTERPVPDPIEGRAIIGLVDLEKE